MTIEELVLALPGDRWSVVRETIHRVDRPSFREPGKVWAFDSWSLRLDIDAYGERPADRVVVAHIIVKDGQIAQVDPSREGDWMRLRDLLRAVNGTIDGHGNVTIGGAACARGTDARTWKGSAG